jgi:hypothetical protein
MRALTPKETELLEQRRARFEQFLEDRMPVLAEFAELLELQNPTMIVADPDLYLPSIDVYMRRQVVLREDRASVILVLGYLIGEVLVQRLSGGWLLNESPDSRYFLRYVVGRFARVSNLNAMADPFEAATIAIDEPSAGGLKAVVADVERALRAT